MAWFGKSNEQKTQPPQTAPELFCSFCHNSQRVVEKLIAGPEVWICDKCVRICMDIVDDKVPTDTAAQIPSPPPAMADLRAAFDARCVGLDAQKQALLSALSLHLQRLQEGASDLRPPIVLLVGPRGSGKSTLLRAMTELTRLPGHHADINRLSATGYIGLDVENLLWELVRQSERDYRLAECGVLALDGLHRVTVSPPALGTRRDISGEAVQRDLLRTVEGMKTEVHGHSPRHPHQAAEPFWCHKLLVVMAASFDGLPDGEQAQRAWLADQGLLGEMLARVDWIVPVPAPDAEQLRAVLTDPGAGMLTSQLEALRALGRELRVEDDAIDAMVEHAAASPDGAWALKHPLARLATAAGDPDHEGSLVVTADDVRGWSGPA